MLANGCLQIDGGFQKFLWIGSAANRYQDYLVSMMAPLLDRFAGTLRRSLPARSDEDSKNMDAAGYGYRWREVHCSVWINGFTANSLLRSGPFHDGQGHVVMLRGVAAKDCDISQYALQDSLGREPSVLVKALLQSIPAE